MPALVSVIIIKSDSDTFQNCCEIVAFVNHYNSACFLNLADPERHYEGVTGAPLVYESNNS